MLIDLDYQPTEEEKRASKKRWMIWSCNFKLKIFYRHYTKEKNPLYVWSAYHLCRKMDISFPEWILQYLDEVTENLQKPQRPKERISLFLQRALKMDKKGRGNIFQRYLDTEKKIDAVCRIIELLYKKLTLETALCQISEEMGISEDALSKWYYQYRAFLLKPI